jgi:hypothetical protein
VFADPSNNRRPLSTAMESTSIQIPAVTYGPGRTWLTFHLHDIRVVGPNCIGLINTDPFVRFNATFAPTPQPQAILQAGRTGTRCRCSSVKGRPDKGAVKPQGVIGLTVPAVQAKAGKAWSPSQARILTSPAARRPHGTLCWDALGHTRTG